MFIQCVVLSLILSLAEYVAVNEYTLSGKKRQQDWKKTQRGRNTYYSHHNQYTKLPYNILNLHFHKSGGTTVCKMFKKIYPKHTPGNCNCKFCPIGKNKQQQPWQLDDLFKNGRTQFCAIESGDCWPKPHVFHQLASQFSGKLMTVMRDPWARYLSNFERDYARCEDSVRGTGVNCSLTIKSWATLGDRGYKIDNITTYHGTLTSRPNFYVRMLNGLANPQNIHVKDLGASHLSIAKHVLMAFSSVSLLEQDEIQRQDRIDSTFKLKGLQFGGKHTNNIYSNSHNAEANKKSQAVIPAAIEEARMHKPMFENLNHVDYELYRWVQNYFNITVAT